MRSPRNWYAIDQALGQTPCLCGAVDTWHPACFAGKTQEEIDIAYVKAYKIARKHLRDRAADEARAAIAGCGR